MKKDEDPKRTDRERRRHPRAEEIFIVTYRLKSPLDVTLQESGRAYAAVAMDIGAGGLGVDVDRRIAPGTRLHLTFKMVNDLAAAERNREREFTLDGECRYCEVTPKQSWRAGILFKNASGEDGEFISEYIKDQTLKRSHI
jgi:hypothetical protein